MKKRDNCPGSVAALQAEARFARPHDRLVAVFDADLVEDAVKTHARKGGFPANAITRVRTVIDPTTAEAT